MKITCTACEEKVEVNMYFFNTKIVKDCDLLFNREFYKAYCSGKTICPNCGSEIFKIYAKPVDEKDIINFAIGKEVR